MNGTTITLLLSVPWLVLEFFSILCNVYVFVSSKLFQRNLIDRAYATRNESIIKSVKSSHDYIITNIISWLVCIDTLNGITTSLGIIPLAFDLPPLTTTLCTLSGMCGQFFGTLSPLWHILLASYLFYLLTIVSNIQNGSNYSNSKHEYLQNPKIYFWTKFAFILFCFLCTIIPFFVHPHCYKEVRNYYDAKNEEYYGAECWVTGYWEWIQYVIIILSLLFHYLVLILAFEKYNQTKAYTNAFIFLVDRLVVWVVVFSIIRIFPTLDRIWSVIDDKTVPLWVVVSHHCCLGAIGIANGIVWYLNRKTDPYKQIHDDDDDDQDDKHVQERERRDSKMELMKNQKKHNKKKTQDGAKAGGKYGDNSGVKSNDLKQNFLSD